MQIKVKLNYSRIAPRKVRQVADMIRGKGSEQAQNILEFTVRKPVVPILKLLNSALATAKHEFQIEATNLYISKIIVDEGPKLKRFRPVSRGSAHPLWKRTSHITLILDEIDPTAKKKTARSKGKTKGESSFAKATADKKEESIEAIETKPVQENGEISKEEDFQKKKPAYNTFERRDFKKKKGQNVLNKMFRRKSI
ncbi:50S ribosomal protein L22 [Patescibacteria group bacterium]|nr:50S ribosomal protein L22 [Patescibacteria group bacterium]